jgi:CheY-like chemotaxis protein
MQFTTAIVVDDKATHRHLTARVLQQAGWSVHLAHDGVSGARLAKAMLMRESAEQTLILTDLHMPWSNDPHDTLAGTHLALYLRTSMDRGELPQAPIIALTVILDDHVQLRARACGCDAVLGKPATCDLPERIAAALGQSSVNHHTAEQALIITMLRAELAAALLPVEPTCPTLTIADLNAALLAYRRRGGIGLGESRLAHLLAPDIAETLARGEAIEAMLRRHLECLARQHASAVGLLQAEMELDEHADDQHPAISKSTYYRLRGSAITLLREALAHQGAAQPD